MSRDDLFIQQKLMPVIGDVCAPGFESRRVALEIAQQRVNNRVVHTGSPTGNPTEHGMPDTYRGLLPFASNAHLNAIIVEVKELEKESMLALKTRARQLGYYSHPPDTNRFDLVKGPLRHMESFDRDGNHVMIPIYGNGQGQDVGGSRYAHLADADADAPYVLGGGQTEEQSKFHGTPDPPRLRDGSIDYDKLNELNSHGPMRGRRNFSVRQG
jgi:hypothetical protein